MNTPCNSCKRLLNALNKINKRYQGPAGNIAGQAIKEHLTSQQPSPQPVPPSVVTVEEFQTSVFGYLTEDCLLDRCEIHGAILNMADKYPNGLRVVE